MAYTFSTELFSDLHKDVYGFRPRGHWFYDANTTDAERQDEWDYLCKRLGEQIDEDNVRNAKALHDLQAKIADLKTKGAQDDKQALKWIVQSLDPSEIDLRYGGEWVCWELGLSFDCGYMFNEVCEELRDKLEIAA
jgi:hypothetical protein